MSTPLAAFGPGILIVTRTDTTTPVAINVGFSNELTLDFSGTIKELYGQNQYPLVAARGTIKATGKWKAAVISGIAWNAAFYGMSSLSTSSAFNNVWVIDSTFTLSASTTVLTVSTGNFEQDLGVKISSNSLPFQRVATGSESSGKYSISSTSTGLVAGTYNFSAADIAATLNLKITYTTTVVGTAGQALQVTNQLIGTTPTFQLDYYTNLNQPASKPFVVRVYACVAAKQMLAAKLEDFIMPEFDFSIFANAGNQVLNYVFPEIS